ncbi:hypothetical protein BKA69DRAFT_1047923 [Paraphysoderma sedebokerense]|nr:hypothetical protein BKA69DRAFT_1047705 [Paraphysoderma sedebokerense]KAI9145491.1 hypothetical protein BKA69DRAFT_1047923 [Paraphysoderma sedebokerense]
MFQSLLAVALIAILSSGVSAGHRPPCTANEVGKLKGNVFIFAEPDVESEVCSYAKVGSKLTHWNRGPYILSGGFIKVDAWGTDCPYGQGWVLANYIDCIPK